MTETFIYIMAVTDPTGWKSPIKVGITSKPEKRLSAIRTACPYPISLYRSYRLPTRANAEWLESSFHRVNTAHRMAGEWFSLSPRDADESLCTGLAFMLHEINGLTQEQTQAWLDWAGADCEFKEAA